MMQIRSSHRSRAVLVSLLGAATLCCGLVLGALTLELLNGDDRLRETGPVEMLTLVFYVLAVWTFSCRVPLQDDRRLLHIPVLLALMMMREMDLDKAFLSEGILTLRLYTGDAPLWEKFAGAIAIAAVTSVCVPLILRGSRLWIHALRAGTGWALWIVAMIGVVAVSKLLDGISRKLTRIGIVMDEQVGSVLSIAEETLEAFIPVLIFAAILQRWPRRD